MHKVSMVFQDVYLFQDTIAGNIRFGRSGATHEEIEEAAKLACCHEFIMKLPYGMTRWSEKADAHSRAVRNSAFPLPGRCWKMRRFFSSMKQRPRSFLRTKWRFRKQSIGLFEAEPSSWSLIDSRRAICRPNYCSESGADCGHGHLDVPHRRSLKHPPL